MAHDVNRFDKTVVSVFAGPTLSDWREVRCCHLQVRCVFAPSTFPATPTKVKFVWSCFLLSHPIDESGAQNPAQNPLDELTGGTRRQPWRGAMATGRIFSLETR